MEVTVDKELDLICDADVRERLLYEVMHSQKSIWIATFHFGYFYHLIPYLEGKQNKIILNDHFQNKTDRRLAITIGKKLEGIAEVRYLRDLHAKLYIFDEERVIIGSPNITKKSLFYNREIILWSNLPGLLEDAINIFEDWWIRAKRR